MGIIANGCSIFFGGLLGCILKNRLKLNNAILGIAIMLLGSIGVLENIFTVSGKSVVCSDAVVIILMLMFGSMVGEMLRLEEKIKKAEEKSKNETLDAIIAGSIFFGVGGLQISGAITLALSADSSNLFLKSMIDFPFALTLGATYGFAVSFSCIPVMLVQVFIALCAYFLGAVFNDEIIRQICALGYIILFFFGFNLMASEERKIQTLNMLPSIFLLILYHIGKGLF